MREMLREATREGVCRDIREHVVSKVQEDIADLVDNINDEVWGRKIHKSYLEKFGRRVGFIVSENLGYFSRIINDALDEQTLAVLAEGIEDDMRGR